MEATEVGHQHEHLDIKIDFTVGDRETIRQVSSDFAAMRKYFFSALGAFGLLFMSLLGTRIWDTSVISAGPSAKEIAEEIIKINHPPHYNIPQASTTPDGENANGG